MYLRNGTRLIQTREQKKKNLYLLYNNQVSNTLTINSTGVKIIKKIFNNKQKFEKDNVFLESLINYHFASSLQSEIYSSRAFISNRCKYNLPLTNINLELTNMCNLKCVHCYGSFCKNIKSFFIPYEWIEKSLDDFDKLNVKSISLTGGECTLHPKFIDIVILLLKRGYELCIFTNGYNYEIIEELLERTKEYRYMIKVSLDSYEEIHNTIRGNAKSFNRTTKCLKLLKKYDNISVYISTVIMKHNLHYYYDFREYVKMEYPDFIHTTDLIFPEGNGNECSFSLEELEKVKKEIPSLFELQKNISKKNKRCSGGISQCTITPDGYLKICNSACDEEFKFKHNAFEKGIIKSWLDCGKNIKHFRREKSHSSKKCKKCINRKKCNITDCRVLAKSYTGSCLNCNPMTCMIVKGEN